MKRKTKIILGVVVVILTLLGMGVLWQWENINAFIESRRYSQEELVTQIDEQKAEVESVLKDYGLDSITDFTFEEEEAIRKGEMTIEEAIKRLDERNKSEKAKEELNTSQAQNEAAQNQSEGKVQGSETQTIESSSKAVIEEAINEMYALKAKYIGQLGVLERAARSDYAALKGKQKKASAAQALISKYMGPALAAQGSCDAEVASVLNHLESELNAIGESTDIVQTMRSAYEQEKSLKKAYYLSLVK